MTGISGALTASPTAAPSTSSARLTIRTERSMAQRTMQDFGLVMLAEMAAPIRLTVPGTLHYRAVAVRVVAEAARLVSCSGVTDPNDPLAVDVRDPFDTAVVSAFAEIFNNVAIHAYHRKGGGTIEIAITPGTRELVIEVKDHGSPFDLEGVAPLPDVLDDESLPEGGMG